MNDRQLEYMLTIAKEGSVSRAAQKLCISQPSLSQMIKSIETSLGASLFNRYTSPLTLTPAGERYMAAARQITAISENLQKEINEINREDRGVLRLGIPVQRGIQITPYFLPKFHAQYPLVTLKVEEFGSAVVESMVLEGDVDIGCITTYPQHEELNYTLVETEELILLTSARSPLAHRVPPGTRIDITEVRDEEFIAMKPGHSVRTTLERLCISHNFQPKILLETSNIEVGKRAAVAADAVMLCPAIYLDTTPDLLREAAVYPVEGIENQRHFYICHRKDLYLTRYMRDFIQLMLRICDQG